MRVYECDQIVLGFLFPFTCFVCFFLFFCFFALYMRRDGEVK